MSCQFNWFAFLAAMMVASFFGGCAYSVHQYHVSDSEGSLDSQPKAVQAQGEQSVFMGFAGDVDYVEEAYAGLLKSCPNGAIDNIHTRFSTSLGFFSWTNRIVIRGECHTSQ